MKKGLVLGGSSALLVGLLLFTGWSTQAATDKYSFLIRGIVKSVDTSGHNLNVYVTHTSDKAGELSGTTQDFNVKPSLFYKWVKGHKQRIKQSGIVVGDEVVMKGVAKGNDTFNVNWVVVNDRSFEIIGKLKENDTSAKTLKVDVSSSTYKTQLYKDQTLTIHYDSNTDFMSNGQQVGQDEVTGSDQRVKIKGTVNDESTWTAATLWDNYNKTK